MNYRLALEYIYPDIVIEKDYILRDDGKGVYISEWSYDKPQPTLDELNAAWDQVKNEPLPEPPLTLEERVKILEEKVKALENA